MPRKPRLFSPEIAYHVICRGNNRQTIFRKSEDFTYYLFLLKFLKEEFVFDVYHYCLMSNHVHMLMRFPTLQAFRKVPQRLSLLYAKYFARQYHHIGHVFQDRFKSIPVENNSYLLECGRYIERNPVSAKITTEPTEYRWSSAGFYLEGTANSILTMNPLYLDLAIEDGRRRELYRSFVMIERPYEAMVEKTILGKHLVR
jgi:putative transposase